MFTVWVLLFLGGCKDDLVERGASPEWVDVIRPLKLTGQARVPENDAHLKRVEVHENKLVFHREPAELLDPSLETRPYFPGPVRIVAAKGRFIAFGTTLDEESVVEEARRRADRLPA